MPALLGPTNPVPGYDSTPVRVTTPPPGDTSVQNIVDPNRVVRPDNRTEQQDTGDATGSHVARYESNFMTFLQRLRDAQDLPATFMRLLQGQGLEISSGIRPGFAAMMGEFLEFLKMDESQLLAFIKNQTESGSRFGGALFSALRTAYAGTRSDLLRTDILQFLKRFSDFTSTDHIESKIIRTGEDMAAAMPGKWSAQASEVLEKLESAMASGDRAGALQLLRGELFPLVARYVSATHDHGKARNLLSMLALDVARYENGSKEGMLQALRRLAANGALPEELNKLQDDDLLRLLKDSSFFRSSESNTFADRLAKLTHQALQGQGGADAQEAFHHILTSILINESVYMPLNHMMIPLDWNGQLMFSEMWVDPDAERDTRAYGEAPVTRMLIKMDIDGLGMFDVLINARNLDVAMQIACPRSVAEQGENVSRALREILERNGLTASDVRVAPMIRPAAVSDAFPKLFERVSGVNVKV